MIIIITSMLPIARTPVQCMSRMSPKLRSHMIACLAAVKAFMHQTMEEKEHQAGRIQSKTCILLVPYSMHDLANHRLSKSHVRPGKHGNTKERIYQIPSGAYKQVVHTYRHTLTISTNQPTNQPASPHTPSTWPNPPRRRSPQNHPPPLPKHHPQLPPSAATTPAPTSTSTSSPQPHQLLLSGPKASASHSPAAAPKQARHFHQLTNQPAPKQEQEHRKRSSSKTASKQPSTSWPAPPRKSTSKPSRNPTATDWPRRCTALHPRIGALRRGRRG